MQVICYEPKERGQKSLPQSQESPTFIVSENWAVEFGQTTASWNRKLGQNFSSGHGIERNQTLAGV
jgi:hypothetical protein